ncbi:Coiled-coil domain-containing protein 148 [Lonchura striata]|uniref:Coiled-coil domain-containing protein 148 n=1 Tax=Lonchura striata TaxID=40157 RepID=A0A218UCY8_9PASE|nr:Coiled-coil domain-containing protein 148 [Lonchura striata domestica]
MVALLEVAVVTDAVTAFGKGGSLLAPQQVKLFLGIAVGRMQEVAQCHPQAFLVLVAPGSSALMYNPSSCRCCVRRLVVEVDNLVVPAGNALCSQKYKPVDYKHLYDLAVEAKMASAQIQLKIKKAEQVSKISKEQMLLKQHRQVWWQEFKKLSESRQKAEEEMKTFLDEDRHKNNFFFDLRDLEQKLSKEWDTYQTNALVPVWQLKEDLKLELSKMWRYLSKESCQKPKINSAEMLQQIKFIKKQQKAILEGLILESLALERELEECKENALVHSSEEKNGLFLEVPPELLALECPYPDLKTLVMEEYQELASGYWAKLQEVDQQLEALARNSDWKEEDQWVFQTVINQYPSDLQRRRTLYLDMLQRYLPHKSRQELVVHEKAWDHYHSIRNQRRVLLLTWAQVRKAFVLRAVAAAAEAAAAHEEEVVLADSRQKQLEICADLKAKELLRQETLISMCCFYLKYEWLSYFASLHDLASGDEILMNGAGVGTLAIQHQVVPLEQQKQEMLPAELAQPGAVLRQCQGGTAQSRKCSSGFALSWLTTSQSPGPHFQSVTMWTALVWEHLLPPLEDVDSPAWHTK